MMNLLPVLTCPRDVLIQFHPDALPEVPELVPGVDRMVVDLNAIALIDSRLIQRLMEIVHALDPAQVFIRHARARVQVQLRLLGFDRIFTIESADSPSPGCLRQQDG